MPASVPSLSQAYADQKKRNSVVAISIAAICLVVAATFAAMGGLKSLGVGASNAKPGVLNAPGEQPSNNVLTAMGSTGPPVLNQEAKAPEKMPQDVFDWLKHLERCEAMKVEISGDQMAELAVISQKLNALGAGIGMLDPYDQATNDEGQAPGSYTKGKVLDLRPRWEELISFFRSVPPPDECRPIAEDFDRAISELPAMMGDVGDILNMADSDPQEMLKKANKLKGASYGDVDRYFARCDEKVSAICQKYNTHKWFNVKQDVMAGGMMGKLSGF